MKTERKNSSKQKPRSTKNDDLVKSIGVIIKTRNYAANPSLPDGIKEYAEKKGYKVIISSSYNDHENEKNLINLFITQKIPGIIIDPVCDDIVDTEHLAELKKKKYPLVLLDDVEGLEATVITVNHKQAIKKLVKYLLSIGHSKIIHFSAPLHSKRSQERIEGFKQALIECSVEFKNDLIIPIGADYSSVYNNALDYFQLLNEKNYPTAVVCFNDFHALAVTSALKSLQINVPEDISITGIDDIFFSKGGINPLTTIRIPQYEIGAQASEILIKIIESKTSQNNERFEFPTELIIGESTKKII